MPKRPKGYYTTRDVIDEFQGWLKTQHPEKNIVPDLSLPENEWEAWRIHRDNTLKGQIYLTGFQNEAIPDFPLRRLML